VYDYEFNVLKSYPVAIQKHKIRLYEISDLTNRTHSIAAATSDWRKQNDELILQSTLTDSPNIFYIT
jgi:hypothetical protein